MVVVGEEVVVAEEESEEPSIIPDTYGKRKDKYFEKMLLKVDS